MPNIHEMASEIHSKEKKKIVKGIRPDHLARTGSLEAAAAEVENEKKSTNPNELVNPLVNGLVNNPNELVNPLVNGLVNNPNELVNPLVNGLVNHKKTENPHEVPIGKPIGKRRRTAIGKPLVNPLVNDFAVSKETTLDRVKRLRGYQKQILFYVIESCISRGELSSGPITNETLRHLTGADLHSVKTTVQRLINKIFLTRKHGQRGNGGYSIFSTTGPVRDAVIEASRQVSIGKPLVNPLVNGDAPQLVNHRYTDRETNAPSSSSIDLNNKTTTTGTPKTSDELPVDWNEIDTSPLVLIRFGRHQLLQLVGLGKMSAEEVQDSIYAFAFDLEVNGKQKEINGAALNYFMGILRKGPYAAPANYEAPELRQRRLYIEAKERERKTREELDSRLEAVEFDSWVVGLSAEDKLRFVPPSDFAKLGSQGHNVQLKQYFREHIWPERRESLP